MPIGRSSFSTHPLLQHSAPPSLKCITTCLAYLLPKPIPKPSIIKMTPLTRREHDGHAHKVPAVVHFLLLLLAMLCRRKTYLSLSLVLFETWT